MRPGQWPLHWGCSTDPPRSTLTLLFASEGHLDESISGFPCHLASSWLWPIINASRRGKRVRWAFILPVTPGVGHLPVPWVSLTSGSSLHAGQALFFWFTYGSPLFPSHVGVIKELCSHHLGTDSSLGLSFTCSWHHTVLIKRPLNVTNLKVRSSPRILTDKHLLGLALMLLPLRKSHSSIPKFFVFWFESLLVGWLGMKY